MDDNEAVSEKKFQEIFKEKEAKRRKEYFEAHYKRFRHGGPEDKTKPEVKKIPKKPEEKEKKPEKDKKAKKEEESKEEKTDEESPQAGHQLFACA